MVRGETGCARYCPGCAQDCRCDSCNQCHTCRDMNHFTGRYMSGTLSGCRYYSHACIISPVETWPDAFVSRLKDFPTLFNSKVVEITIGSGPTKELRYVPKGALTEHSDYFKTSFSFHDKTGTRGNSVVLDTDVDRPGAFDRFIQFIYGKDYFGDEADLDLRLHVDVYVLAERLQAAALKDLALKKATKIAINLRKCVKDAKTATGAKLSFSSVPGAIEEVYINTPGPPEDDETKKDKFRTLISAFSACFLADLKKTTGFMECVRTFPDFSVDVLGYANDGNALEADVNGYLKA